MGAWAMVVVPSGGGSETRKVSYLKEKIFDATIPNSILNED
jgi:hypothetical protein